MFMVSFCFGFFQVFQYLRTFQLNQMNQWNILLHANQPSVPEATPVPGFERMPSHRVDQLVPSSNAQGKGFKAVVILYKRANVHFGTPEVVEDHYRKRKKCHVFSEILSRFVLFFSGGWHSSHVLLGTLDERRRRI